MRFVFDALMHRIVMLFSLLWLIVPSHAGWQSLFNGKDLEGWSGDSRLWRVEGGVLVGETNDADKAISDPSALIWQGGEPGDFELEFQARVTGSTPCGVQYRSRTLDSERWRVGGYQMALHPKPAHLGMLYEEQGRGILCERGQRVEIGDKPMVHGTLEVPEVELNVWNSYRIVAQGYVLRHFINGKLAAEINDQQPEKRAAKGCIALQLNSGSPLKAEFKDLRIRCGTRIESGGPPAAVWIWKTATAAEGEKVFFRRDFQLPPNIASAAVTVICDDSHRLFVNGQDLGAAGGWNTPRSYDVLVHLKPGGRNLIAIEGTNHRGAAGMALRFRATLKDGKKLHIVSDANWRCTSEPTAGWQDLEFPTATWPKAVVVAKMGDAPWGAVMPRESE